MIELVLEDANDKTSNTLAHARTEFSGVRTGRANPALIERLTVEAYGVDNRLQEIAGFAVPEARQLLVTPFDPQNLESIEKAIQNAGLGLNPSNDGRTIRLKLSAAHRGAPKRVSQSCQQHGRGRPKPAARNPPRRSQGF